MTSQDTADSRLGRYVREAREAIPMSQNELSVAANISDTVISQIETGKPGKRTSRTIRSLERALGWEPGSIAAIRSGGEPTVKQGEQGMAGDRPKPKHQPLPGSTNTPPDTIAPSYEVLPGVWVTTADPSWVTMTPEERLERMKDRVNRAAPDDH